MSGYPVAESIGGRCPAPGGWEILVVLRGGVLYLRQHWVWRSIGRIAMPGRNSPRTLRVGRRSSEAAIGDSRRRRSRSP